MHLKKLFYSSGRNYSTVNPYFGDRAVAGEVNPPVAGDAAGAFGTQAFGYNIVKREEQHGPYDDRTKDVWLLIWADHYPDPDYAEPTHAKHCSFDFKIRSKYTQMV